MLEFIGKYENFSLFSDGDKAVVVDTSLNLISEVSTHSLLAVSRDWVPSVDGASDETLALANAAFKYLEIPMVAAAERMYTIPGGVQAEAKKALLWRHEAKRGGTPVGLNTARTLAKGGQIGIEKVRHIAKYFPRHEVDKKGKGWAPGEEHFPSNGRIAWALWGGDAAQRWASAIVERENKKALAAAGYSDSYEVPTSDLSGYAPDTNAFKMAHELDPFEGPEFMARVRLDNTGIDRLYKIEIDGQVYVWDGSGWDNLGHVDGDIYKYDNDLDSLDDSTEKTHVLIDPSSAIIISAFLQERPFQPVTLDEIDPEETQLMFDGLQTEDFSMIDRVVTAAGEPVTNQDGNYTPDERADKASKQVRDASGQFAKAGSRVVIAGDEARGSGVIENVDSATGLVSVKLDTGDTISVDAKYTRAEDTKKTGPRRVPQIQAPLDTSGILAVPRTPKGAKAQLPGTLPTLTSADIQQMINDYPAWVAKQRASYKLNSDTDKAIKVVTKGKKTTAPGLKNYDKKYMKDHFDAKYSTDGFTASAEAASDAISSPKESDVPAKYLAIVSPDEKTAVMDLIAIVPDSKTGTAPTIYAREDGAWVKNDQILMDLKSATPPPVVPLDDKEVLNDVLVQVDNSVQASGYDFAMFWDKVVEPLLAAGGLDRNRGNAEELRRYWTSGKGAAKIRWGTPGDWTRCVRNLSKYMGPRAKGYCQLRHKDATGVYTGSRANPGRKSGGRNFASLYESEQVFIDKMIDRARMAALAADAREKIGLVASAATKAGARFTIPMLVPEGVESGDGRKFADGAISVRELPVPLLWQIKTGAGHDGSVVVGRIDYVERIEGGMGNAFGVFDSGPYGREAERLVKHGFLRGVSVDLDQFEAKEEKKPVEEMAEDGGQEIGKDKLTINKARIMAATIVAKPAFQECSILLNNEGDQEDNVTPEDGVYEESVEDFSDVEPLMASGFLNSDIPMTPPTNWFDNPNLTKATPLTVDDDGRVYGHIAAWNVNHIGLPRATKPPRSRSNYAYFHTGVLRTDNGSDVPVGQLTLAGGHAPLNADAASAARHYDDTASAVADIHVGEDEYGIWCAGSLRPGLEEMQIRALRASAPSGDWRPIQGSLELVAICQVNVPGFPTARAMIASGKILALVAAGAHQMAVMRSQAVQTLAARADLLGQLAATAPDLKSRVKDAKKAMRSANLQAITASAEAMREVALTAAAIAELAKISNEDRAALAKEGKAMPDGAYPIRNAEDLKNAIQAYGRAKASERAAVRKHIMKQARSLKQWDLIPSTWKNADSMEAAEKVASMRAAITAAALNGEAVVAAAPKAEEISDSELKKLKDAKAEADKQTEEEIKAAEDVKANKGKTPVEEIDPTTGEPKFVSGINQPRDAKGKYRTVLARLKQNLGVAGLAKALKKAEDAENLDFAGDYTASAAASQDLLGMVDRLDSKALNPKALENVRMTAGELGKTIANLPLPFGQDAEKLKFSDLPSGLKDLIDGMITRVEAKIGKKDADIATQSLRSYMSGADLYSQSEVQSEMSKLLRLLT
jgi:hypothetical protein